METQKRKLKISAKKKEKSVKARDKEEIKLDSNVFTSLTYDDCNALALPSKKQKKNKEKNEPPAPKKLSKKKRRHLESVIKRREKKAKRGELLEALQTVQVHDDEIQMLTSTSEMQTGLCKQKVENRTEKIGDIINNVKGSNKKLKISNIHTDEDSTDTSDITTEDENDDEMSENKSIGDITLDSSSLLKDQTDDDLAEKTLSKDDSTTSNIRNEENMAEVEGDGQCGDARDEKLDGGNNDMANELKVERLSGVKSSKSSNFVHVQRQPHIQEARLALPILAEEQSIMEAITENDTVIICGETGSGKTTQVPQFLYEAGYTRNGKCIAVTEPRRIAAVSMSQRVMYELMLSSREVSYQIRYEGNVTDETCIKFVTDGVLLKEIQKDFLLKKYSVVIIDEAHERSVYTDVLIGLLSRIVPLRNKRGDPLKLVIMSATLRVEDFTQNSRLFKDSPPVLQIDSRQFPVTVHFNKTTPLDDYVNEAFKKICKIHKLLPSGGILVFVTGRQEVNTLCRKLQKRFPSIKSNHGSCSSKKKRSKLKKAKKSKSLPEINLDNYIVDPYEEMADSADDSDDECDEKTVAGNVESDDEMKDCGEDMLVLPLFSMLPGNKQSQVFDEAPEGTRKVVVSTNVAETSLTIPGIKYVVDTGRVKDRMFDKVTGVSKFQVTWISKAAASQRAGRAGRLGPGHCYRLYSSAVFNDLIEFSEPEICRRPVDDLLLQMKDMKINKVDNFPFPTPPNNDQLKAAEKMLINLGALQPSEVTAENEKAPSKITPVGHLMACFPISPRFSRMLTLGHQHGLLAYVIVLVAAMSVQELLIELEAAPQSDAQKEEQKTRRQHRIKLRKAWVGTGEGLLLGDLQVLLMAVGSAEFEGFTEDFCVKHGIRYKAMKEVRQLRRQLTNTVNSLLPEANLCLNPKLPPPSQEHIRLLRQIALSGLLDHVARRSGESEVDDPQMKDAYYCNELEDPVFVHPLSVLYKQKADFVLYQRIEETSRLYMKGICAIEPQWLPVLASKCCTFSKILENPSPRYDRASGQMFCHVDCTFGQRMWSIPVVEIEYPQGQDRFKWFGRSFLQGLVTPSLSKYASNLLTVPVTMVKSWAKLKPRTETFLKTLISRNVSTKADLLNVWKSDNKYLLRAYLDWLPAYLHEEVKDQWPPS